MTLVSKIKNILKLPEDVNKEELLKNTIENYRKNYPFLEDIIQRKTTFEETYEPLIDKYTGIKAYLLPKRFTKNEKEILIDTESRILSFLTTPLVNGTIAAGLYTAPSILPNLDASSEAGFYLTAFMWTIVACMSIFVIPPIRDDLKKDLKLLDEQINKIYGGKENGIS